jgi:hypothetical protein
MSSSPSRRDSGRGNGEATRPQSAIATGKENKLGSGFPTLFRPVTSDGTTNRRTPLSTVSDTMQNECLSEPSTVFATPLTSDHDHQSKSVVGNSNATDVALAELAVYAKQPDEVRMNALNKFLLKHLESDDFLVLVDDMDVAWARIAPGFGSAGRQGA